MKPTPFYVFSRHTMRLLLFAFSDLGVCGHENVPAAGPLIVVSNHLNFADPPILGSVLRRDVVFMAKEELFHQPVMNLIVKHYGAFPIKRHQADRQALRQTYGLLEQGGVLGMFPEGTRSRGGGMKRAEPGIALIAARSRAPILPVGITGTEALTGVGWIPRRPKIRLTIGRPFHLPDPGKRLDSSMLEPLADYIMARVAGLLPPDYRGVYGAMTADEHGEKGLASNVESK